MPSYAMMVIDPAADPVAAPVLGYDPAFGLDSLPIFLAMTLLAIPPILVGAYAGLRVGRPRPHRGRPRDGPARAPDPARHRDARSPRRSSSAASGPRRSRSSRPRRSAPSCPAAGSAGSSSTGIDQGSPARVDLRRGDPGRGAGRRGRPRAVAHPAPPDPARACEPRRTTAARRRRRVASRSWRRRRRSSAARRRDRRRVDPCN